MKSEIFRNIRLLPVVLPVIFAAILSCNRDEDNKIEVSDIEHSECLSHRNRNGEKDSSNQDSVSVHYSNGTLFITHYNLDVNCGFDRIKASAMLLSDTIVINEWEVCSAPADCVCEINDSFRINGVKPGRYTLVFRNWSAGEYSQTFNF